MSQGLASARAQAQSVSGDGGALRAARMEIRRLRESLRGSERLYERLLTVEREQRSAAVAAEANLRAILGASPQPLIILDASGIVEYWNVAAERTLGWSAAEIVGKALPIIPPESQDAANQIFFQLLDGGQIVDLEIQRVRKDGSAVHLSLSAAGLRDSSGKVSSIVEIYSDITDRKQTQLLLEHMALHDLHTGLANRAALFQKIRLTIKDVANSGEPFVVLVIDLDTFKQVNDSHGHQAGDDVLREVAQRLERCVRHTDTVARLGGDEFAILLPGATKSHAARVVGKILAALRAPHVVAGRAVSVSASIGIAEYPTDGAAPKDLLHHGDMEMYSAKQGRAELRAAV